MSLKQDIEKWSEGVVLAENQDFSNAEKTLLEISESSARICFCLASCALKQGKMYLVGRHLDEAVKKDPYMAIAYYQRGCYYIHEKKNAEAVEDFEKALTQMRGNLLIDYKQLGLMYKLYSVEVLHNLGYALLQVGREKEAYGRLQEAYKGSLESGESRHQVVKTSLDAATSGRSFQPFKLPSSGLFFKPPRTKTENLEAKNFLGKAKVVASAQDKDDFTGFLGAQNIKRSPSPNILAESTPTEKKNSPSKPTGPPPMPPSKAKSNTGDGLPKKPSMAPPPRPNIRPPPPSHRPSSQSEEDDEIVVKVHYTITRAIVIDRKCTLKDLQHQVCKKFERPMGSINLWYKYKEELAEATTEQIWRRALSVAVDGDRMVLWAYDVTTNNGNSNEKYVEALYDYDSRHSGDLSFKEGEKILLVKELDADWLVGSLHGNTGIFPKSYVTEIK